MTRHKLNSRILALWATLPMARTAQVESRLHRILKPNANRRTLTRRAAFISLVAAALGVEALAALRPAAQAQNDAAASPTAWKQTLPSGATVEVLGVSDPHLSPAVWWKPEGSPLAPPFDPTEAVTSTVKQQRIFAVRVMPPPGSTGKVGIDYNADGVAIVGSGNGMLMSHGQRLPETYVVLAGTNEGAVPARADLRCGVSAGAWETQAIQEEDGGRDRASSTGTVLISRLSEIKGSAAITVTDSLPEVERRVVAVDTLGKVYPADSHGEMGGGIMHQQTNVFDGLAVNNVKEVWFQARPYEWVEFKGIALMSDKK